MNILENGMLINVTINMWEGRRFDREASRKAVRDNQAGDDGALRVSKLLVSQESMKPLINRRNAIRTHFDDRTLPWKKKGARLLPRKMYTTFIEEHSVLEQAYIETAEHFLVNEYQRERDRASFRLGAAFDPDEYPEIDALRRRFSVTVDIDAINDPNDFRVKMDEATVDRIKADITAKTEQRIHEAMGDVWTRVAETVEHFATRMEAQTEEVAEGSRRSPLHATTLTNLIHLVDALPALNIMGDPNLKALSKRLRDTLCGFEIDDLKGKPDRCAEAAAAAREIMEDMAGFMTAFQNL